ncbi:hypothetical protein [Achromobacter aegrifaciens]
MQATKKIVFATTLALVSATACADAKGDSMALHQSVASGLNTFVELGENSPARSKALGEAMDAKVYGPVEKTRAEWRKSAEQEGGERGRLSSLQHLRRSGHIAIEGFRRGGGLHQER